MEIAEIALTCTLSLNRKHPFYVAYRFLRLSSLSSMSVLLLGCCDRTRQRFGVIPRQHAIEDELRQAMHHAP